MTRSDLAALVGSRICHDLISPIGAIGNGMELLSLTDGDTSAEMSLISDSVDNANARIRYFRIAFGASNPDQRVGRNEILSILAATAKGGRFTYFWQPEGDQPRHMVRCALLGLLCIENGLPLGGDIHISRDGDRWSLTGEGRRVNVDQPLWDSLTDRDSDFQHNPAQVQFALLPDVLAEQDRTLHRDHTDTQIRLQF